MADLITATLRERRDTTETLSVFRFELDRELLWEPGQYAVIGLPGEEKRIERPYSICSAPHEKVLELFIELVPGGALSPRIWRLGVGDTVSVRPKTEGRLTLDRKSGRKTHFMVCTVAAVAPFVSCLRHHRARRREGKDGELTFCVIHGGSRSHELTYLEELSRLQEEVEGVRYIPTVSRPWEEPGWTGETGRADEIIRKHLDALKTDPVDITAYLCGHPGMVQSGKGILRRAGLQEDQIREE